MLACVNLLDFPTYYTLVRVLSWLYLNTIYCVYIIKLIIYSCLLVRSLVVIFYLIVFKQNKNFRYVNEFSCPDLTECLKFLIVSIGGELWGKVSLLPL